MSTTLAQLGIEIKTSGVVESKIHLDNLTVSAQKAQTATRELNRTSEDSVKANKNAALSMELYISKLTESSSVYNARKMQVQGYANEEIALINKLIQKNKDHTEALKANAQIDKQILDQKTANYKKYVNDVAEGNAHLLRMEKQRLDQEEFATKASYNSRKLMYENLFKDQQSFAQKMSSGVAPTSFGSQIKGNISSGMSQSGRLALIAGIEKEAELAEPKVNKLTSSLSTLALRYASIGAAIGIGKLMLDTVEQVQNLEMRLRGLTSSAQDYAATEAYLSSVSKEHHKNVLDMSDSFARLLVIEQTGVITREQAKNILEGLSNAQSKTGASANDLKMSMVGMTQALSQGTLQWEEMKQVTDPIPGLMLKIANAAGYTGESAIGDFKKVVSAGGVTSQMFGEILPKAFANYEGAAAAAGDNLSAKYTDIKNSWTELMKVLEQPVNGTVSPVLDAVSGTLDEITAKLKVVVDYYNKAEEIKGRGMRGPDYVPPKPATEANKAADEQALKDKEKNMGMMADAEDWYTEIVIKDEQEQAKAVHEKNEQIKRESESAAKKVIQDAENQAKRLDDLYQSSLYNMQKEIALRGDSSKSASLEYDMINGSLQHLSESKKLYLLQQADELDFQNSVKKGQDAQKSAMDSLIEQYNQLTLSARDAYAAKLLASGVKREELGPLLNKFDEVTKEQEKQKKIDETRKSLESYNSTLDQTKDKLTGLGDISSSVFDGALGGISAMAGAFDNMVKSLEDNTNAMIKLNQKQAENASFQPDASKGITEQYINDVKLKARNTEKYEKEAMRLNQDRVTKELAGSRQMVGAAAKMFDEKSSAAKALHALETTLAVAQMAMQAKEMAMSVMATGKSLVAGAAKFFEQSGWFGFAGVAAMGALMAGLGYGAFGGSGGSSKPPEYSSDTGTVLGDSSAKSESVSKTYQLLKDIHASEYATLQSIDRGISNLHTGINDVITRLFQAGGLTTVNTQAAKNSIGGIGGAIQIGAMLGSGGLAKFDPIANKVLGFLFGGKTTSTVTAQGIQTGATSLNSIMSGGDLSAQQFATIETVRKGGLFSKTKTSYSTQYAALDQSTQKALNDVFSSMGKTMLGLADNLGMGLSARVRNYIIPALSVDLKGLNGEDAAKKLNGVVSAALDTMSVSVFGDVLAQYQQLGEGMLETAVRIVAEVAVVKDAVAMSGLSLGNNAIAVADALVTAAGGLKDFQQQFESFFDKFFSDAEKQSKLYDQLSSQFNRLNIFLPATREGYKKLADGLDLTNKQDQERYNMLLKLSDTADKYYSGLEDANAKAQQLADETAAKAAQLVKNRHSLEIQLLEAQGKTAEALVRKRQEELAAMDESLRTTQLAIYAAQDYAKAQADLNAAIQKSVTEANNALDVAFNQLQKVVNAQIQEQQDLLNSLTNIADKLHAALGITTGATQNVTLQTRAQSQAIIQSALEFAKGGGSLANFAGLEDALTEVSKPAEQLYSSFADYSRAQARVSSTISQLSQYADDQVSEAQQALTVLEQILVQAQLQVDVLRNVNTSMLTVPVAMENFTVKLDAATLAQTYAIQTNTTATGSVSDAMQAFIAAGNAASSAQLALAQQTASSQANTAQAIIDAAQLQTTSTMTTTGAVMQVRVAIADLASQLSGFMSKNSAAWEASRSAWSANAWAWDNYVGSFQYLLQRTSSKWSQGYEPWTNANITSAAAAANIPGFAVGINEVPNDMLANIHKGERILPAADNKELMMRLSEPRQSDNKELNAEIRFLRNEVSKLQISNAEIARTNKRMADILINVTRDGQSVLTTPA